LQGEGKNGRKKGQTIGKFKQPQTHREVKGSAHMQTLESHCPSSYYLLCYVSPALVAEIAREWQRHAITPLGNTREALSTTALSAVVLFIVA